MVRKSASTKKATVTQKTVGVGVSPNVDVTVRVEKIEKVI